MALEVLGVQVLGHSRGPRMEPPPVASGGGGPVPLSFGDGYIVHNYDPLIVDMANAAELWSGLHVWPNLGVNEYINDEDLLILTMVTQRPYLVNRYHTQTTQLLMSFLTTRVAPPASGMLVLTTLGSGLSDALMQTVRLYVWDQPTVDTDIDVSSPFGANWSELILASNDTFPLAGIVGGNPLIFILNAAGLAAVRLVGYTHFIVMLSSDYDLAMPALWGVDGPYSSQVLFHSSRAPFDGPILALLP